MHPIGEVEASLPVKLMGGFDGLNRYLIRWRTGILELSQNEMA
jgi:hypothetical protein